MRGILREEVKRLPSTTKWGTFRLGHLCSTGDHYGRASTDRLIEEGQRKAETAPWQRGVNELFHQIIGYRHGLMDSGTAIPKDWEKLDGFHEFVREWLNFSPNDYGWSCHIWMASFQSQTASLELFFKIWDEYVASWAKPLRKAKKRR